MTPLVLASASTARARLLAASGVEALCDPAMLDEAPIKAESRRTGCSAIDCATRLAEAKARTVASRHPGASVLGSDQMLDCEGRWFDKPRDHVDARAQLQALRGRPHELATAAVVVCDGKLMWRATERSRLTMRDFSDDFLDFYLARMGERVLATVGGYEIEGLGAQLMARIEGDYFAILGLPLLALLEFLRTEGALTR